MPDDYSLSGGKSEFNSTISVQNRMNYWFAMAQEAQKNGDYLNWYKCLVNLYMDLESDMHKDDKKLSKEFLIDLNKLIVDNQNKKNKNSMSFDNTTKFITWHILLMQVFDYAGYKKKSSESPGEVLG